MLDDCNNICFLYGCLRKKGEYVVKNEKDAVAVYTCLPDNMFGLEKIVVFEDKIVTVFDESINDKSEYGCCMREMKTADKYGTSIILNNLSKYKTAETKLEKKSGKYVSTVMFEYNEADKTDPNKNADVIGVVVCNQKISFGELGIKLYYVIWGGECSSDYNQSYDFSTQKWGEIHEDLTLYPMTFDE